MKIKGANKEIDYRRECRGDYYMFILGQINE